MSRRKDRLYCIGKEGMQGKGYDVMHMTAALGERMEMHRYYRFGRRCIVWSDFRADMERVL